MNTIFSFLHLLEGLFCQGLNKYMYEFGVARCQMQFETARFLYFSDSMEVEKALTIVDLSGT